MAYQPSAVRIPLCHPSLLVHLRPEGTIYRQGDAANGWYEVRRGVVRACRYFASGDRHLTTFFYAGDVFGIEREVREETMEAVTAVELVRRDHADIDKGSPNGNLEAVLRTMRGYVHLLGHRTAEQRVAAFLLTLSLRLGTSTGVPVPMSRTDIADHLRLTMHTVSRTISLLCSRKLIAMSGPQTFSVLDLKALRRAAGQEHPWDEPFQNEHH
jgi:CRP/FNR family nitrogen fixation transcriptional regulator